MDPLRAHSTERPDVSAKKKRQLPPQQQIAKPADIDPKVLPSPPLSADDGPTDPLSAADPLSTTLPIKKQQQQQQQSTISVSGNRNGTTTCSSADSMPRPRKDSSVQSLSLSDTSRSSASLVPLVNATEAEKTQQLQLAQQQEQKHSHASAQLRKQQQPEKRDNDNTNISTRMQEKVEEQEAGIHGRQLTEHQSEPLDQTRHVQIKNLDHHEGENKRESREEELDDRHEQSEEEQEEQVQALHPLVLRVQEHDVEGDGSDDTRETEDDQTTLVQGSLQKQGKEGVPSVWSGQHPLFQDFVASTTLEPEELDHDQGETPTAPWDDAIEVTTTSATIVKRHHQKGQSMSVVEGRVQQHNPSTQPIRGRQTSTQPASVAYTPQQFQYQPSSPLLSSGTIRRRAVGGVGEDSRGSDPAVSMQRHTEQRRVIIHPVAPGDTLQGLGLYYGIQIAVLKKSNKLWTNDSIHTRKYLYIPIEECTVLRQAGARIDEEKSKVILPSPRNTPNRGSSMYGGGTPPLKEHHQHPRVRKTRSKSLLASPYVPGQSSPWPATTSGVSQDSAQRRAVTPEIPKISSRGDRISSTRLAYPGYLYSNFSTSSLPYATITTTNIVDSEHEHGEPLREQQQQIPLQLSDDLSEVGTPLAVMAPTRPPEPATPLLPVGAKCGLSSMLSGKSKAAPPIPSSAMTTTTLLTGSFLSPLSPKRMSMTSLPSIAEKNKGNNRGTQHGHGRRGGEGGSSSGGGTSSSDASSSSISAAVPFSDDLPATLKVHPSMTHEALAQRFKHMDSASKDNRNNIAHSGSAASGSVGLRQRELRTNPVHNLHQVVDMRPQFFHHQSSYSATRKSSVDSSSEVASVSSSTHTRMVSQQQSLTGNVVIETPLAPSTDGKINEQTLERGGGSSTTETANVTSPLASSTTLIEEAITEHKKLTQPDTFNNTAAFVAAPPPPEDAFIIYGHHEHIYRNQDQSSDDECDGSVVSDHDDTSEPSDGELGSELSEHGDRRHYDELLSGGATSGGVGGRSPQQRRRRLQRQQDVVTVPAGRLSFFPSAEHSKRLETPEPILRLQDNALPGGDETGYFSPYGSISGRHSKSSSGTSSRASTQSSGSLSSYLPNLPSLFSSLHKATGSEQQQHRQKGGPTRRRTALDANTFKSPASNEGLPHQGAAPTGASTKTRPTASHHHHPRGGIPAKPTTRNVRSPSLSSSSSPWSSFMSDTLVDDILGAVRGKLQIARRLYLGNTSLVGAIVGGDTFSKAMGAAAAKRRSINNCNEYMDAIEMDFSSSHHETPATSIVSSQQQPASQAQDQGPSPPQRNYGHPRRSPSSNSRLGNNRHHRKETSESSSIFEDDGTKSSSLSQRRSSSNHGSLKRRSLRTSNPVNYPALAALVADLDVEQKKQQKQQQQQKQCQQQLQQKQQSEDVVVSKETQQQEAPAVAADKEKMCSPLLDPLAAFHTVSQGEKRVWERDQTTDETRSPPVVSSA